MEATKALLRQCKLPSSLVVLVAPLTTAMAEDGIMMAVEDDGVRLLSTEGQLGALHAAMARVLENHGIAYVCLPNASRATRLRRMMRVFESY